MLPRVMDKAKLGDFLTSLQGDYEVFGPVQKNKSFVFDRVQGAEELSLDYTRTILPPKKYVVPQYETLLKYKMTGQKVDVAPVLDAPKRVVFGVHPCDVYALWLMGDVFRDKDGDPYYQSRSENALIIGLECKKPCDENCFCQDMGSLWVKAGYDMMFTDLEDRFFIDLGTERGRELLMRHASAKAATPEDFNAKQKYMEEKGANFRKKIPVDVRYLPELLEQSMDSLVWQAQSRKCVACGQCTLVCPTCYCFNVEDRLDLDVSGGQRRRHWDSCMLEEFSKVATGENFRERVPDRLRHRCFRKGKYILEKFGKSGCVGCGRCIITCPAKINILEIFNLISTAGSSI